jgi:hypothetical protein
VRLCLYRSADNGGWRHAVVASAQPLGRLGYSNAGRGRTRRKQRTLLGISNIRTF